MDISIQYWTPKILLLTFLTGFGLSLFIFSLTTYLLGAILNLFAYNLLWSTVGSLLLALIIGLLATLFVAKTWIRSKFLFAFLMASVIPLVFIAELFFHHPLLLTNGTLSIIGLFLLYLTSLIGITIADKHITNQLEILLRVVLIPPQTLDLKTLDWLQQEQRDFIRYVWKLKLLQTAATHINYHISTTQHLEPNSHHTSDQNICS